MLPLAADETDDLLHFGVDDIDSIFNKDANTNTDTTDTDTTNSDTTNADTTNTVPETIGLNQTGFSLNLKGRAYLGGTLDWADKPEPAYNIGVLLSSSLSLFAQFTENLKLSTSLSLSLPGLSLENAIDSFYMDYNLLNAAYFTVGYTSINWGVAHNFSAANLVNRVPDIDLSGKPYLLRIDFPLGIGGFQVVAIARDGTSPDWFKQVGYGLKYNLARQHLDMDIGIFYQPLMPLRAYTALNTTLPLDFEVYAELVGILDQLHNNTFAWTADAGVSNTFFANRLAVNAELFYNTENNAYVWQKDQIESAINGKDEYETSPFYKGWNTALNIGWRFGGNFKPVLGLSWLHNFSLNSGKITAAYTMQFLPGITFTASGDAIVGSAKGYGSNTVKYTFYTGIAISGSTGFAYWH
jgi:hypothetical protein